MHIFILSSIICAFGIGLYFTIKNNLHAIPSLISSTSNFLLSYLIFLKDKYSKITKSFILWSISLAVFNMAIWGLYISPNETFAMYWGRFFRTGLIFLPSTFYNFVYYFVRCKNKFRKNLIYIFYGFSEGFAFLNFLGLFENRYFFRFNKWYPEYGVIYTTFSLFLLIVSSYSIWLLYQRQKECPSCEKNQIRYIYLASAILLIFGFTNTFASLGYAVYPMGSIGYLFYSGIIGYAIIEDNLLDLVFVLKKSFIYLLLVAILSVAYIGSIWAFMRIYSLINNEDFFSNGIIYSLSGIIVGLLILPLRNLAQKWIDNKFLKS